jgi:DNA-binding response OmpR family regulator/two-component sensor histidine kinase
MADQIEEKPDAWLGKGVSMIKRNTHNLLELVNQILDLSKLEAGKLKMTVVQADLIAYLRFILESFHSLAERNDIKLSFNTNVEQLWMDYDAEKLLRIVSNLIDNAIKYTKEGGDVTLTVNSSDESQVKIEIKDTGIGIPEKELPHIFDRFYQVEGSFGTGIGLSLVKQLVHLMDGQIHAESEENKGTSFFLQLPVKREAEKQEHISTAPTMIYESESDTEIIRPNTSEEFELPHLLIVEDNEDVAQYLVAYLEGHYKISLAHNGQEGIDAAFEHIPDLIVSDVMMPIKNGYELCNTLKTDQRTSHIPIVLLTAKADIDSKIEGLQKGADAYLAKPFDKKELRTRLEKLLELRTALQKRYQVDAEEVPVEAAVEVEIEDEFIQMIKAAVFENLDDIDFGIPELCRAIGMSRTQLHRKTKALTGRSTSSFIRSIRLGKAKELLNTSNLNISQIAYEVGFKDPKYFSRTFAEEFGISPNQMR